MISYTELNGHSERLLSSVVGRPTLLVCDVIGCTKIFRDVVVQLGRIQKLSRQLTPLEHEIGLRVSEMKTNWHFCRVDALAFT